MNESKQDHIEHYFPKGYNPDEEPWKSIKAFHKATIQILGSKQCPAPENEFGDCSGDSFVAREGSSGNASTPTKGAFTSRAAHASEELIDNIMGDLVRETNIFPNQVTRAKELIRERLSQMNPKHQQILDLVRQLREVAEPIGPLHGWWDLIADLEEFVAGRPTILQKTADEWIAYAQETLDDRKRRLSSLEKGVSKT